MHSTAWALHFWYYCCFREGLFSWHVAEKNESMTYGLTKMEQASHGTWGVTTPHGEISCPIPADFSHFSLASSKAGIPFREKGSFSTFRHQSWHKGYGRIQQTMCWQLFIFSGRLLLLPETVSLCGGYTNCLKAHLIVLAEQDEASDLNLSQFPIASKSTAKQALPQAGFPKRWEAPRRARQDVWSPWDRLAWPLACAEHRAPATQPTRREMRTSPWCLLLSYVSKKEDFPSSD